MASADAAVNRLRAASNLQRTSCPGTASHAPAAFGMLVSERSGGSIAYPAILLQPCLGTILATILCLLTPQILAPAACILTVNGQLHRAGGVPAGWSSPDALSNGGSANGSGLTAMPNGRGTWGSMSHGTQLHSDTFPAGTPASSLYAIDTMGRCCHSPVLIFLGLCVPSSAGQGCM